MEDEMENTRIAVELLSVAKSIMAGSGFTIVKPLALKAEVGGTKVSLENAKRIMEAGYGLDSAVLDFDSNKADFHTIAKFSRGREVATWEFTGFSIGYGGEGPRGLIEFAAMFGLSLDRDKVLTYGVFPEKVYLNIHQLK